MSRSVRRRLNLYAQRLFGDAPLETDVSSLPYVRVPGREGVISVAGRV